MKRRLISFVVAISIVCSFFVGISPIASAETYSGNCGAEGDGSNLTWALDTESGQLMISGTGKMKSYSTNTNRRAPWYDYRDKIKFVSLPEGLTYVGAYAFYSCNNITTIQIPSAVSAISDGAFESCAGLHSVVFSDGCCANGIKQLAFDGCYGLKNVIIPSSVSFIGSQAFRCCSLDSITILGIECEIREDPDWGETLDTEVIYGYEGSTAQDYAENHAIPFIMLINDLPLFSGYCGGEGDGTNLCWSLDIETGILAISGTGKMKNYSYNNPRAPWYPYRDYVDTVAFSNGVSSIGDVAFWGCSALTDVEIPDSVTRIGVSAFTSTSLSDVVIPNSVTEICHHAFASSTLSTITIGNNVARIGDMAFYNCTSLTSVYISDLEAWCTMTFESPQSNPLCFANQLYLNGTLLTELTIPDGVTDISDYAFCSCSCLNSMTIPEGVLNIGRASFENCTALDSITISESVTSIGDEAFKFCTSLTSVIIPSSVVSIGSDAFNACTALKIVTFEHCSPDIGSAAFGRCSAITGVYISDVASWCRTRFGNEYSNPLFYAGQLYLNGNAVYSLTIPTDVNSISDYAFYNSSALEITIGSNVDGIGEETFTGCSCEFYCICSNDYAQGYAVNHNIPYSIFHDWAVPTYNWSEDNLTVSANVACRWHDTQSQSETVSTSQEITKVATCTEDGEIIYTASFTNPRFSTQEKTVALEALGHCYENGVCTRCGNADPHYPDALLTISGISQYVRPGQTFTVSVPVHGGAEIAGFTFSISTNDDIQLTKVEKGALLSEIDGTLTKNLNQGLVNWNGSVPFAGEGELLVLTYTVSEDAEPGLYVPMILRLRDNKPTNMTDQNGLAIPTRFEDGVFVVSTTLYGDTNSDLDIDSADAVRLVRSLVDLETLTPDQQEAADVSHDHDVTSADAIILTRYLAGFIDRLDLITNSKNGGMRSNRSSTVTVQSVACQAGDTITLPVSISGNTGFAGFTLEISFPEELSLLSVAKGAVLEESDGGAFLFNPAKNLINWNDAENLCGDGELLILTFQVSETAADGTYSVALALKDGKPGNFVDEEGNHVSPVFISGTVAVGNQPTVFTDVSEGSWYYDAVMWAVNHEPPITAGTSETTFSPNQNCTRAQIVTFLWRAAGSPTPTVEDLPFTDVYETAYYYDAVRWAYEQGITTGISEHTFGARKTCSRAEAVTFLWRAADSPSATQNTSVFSDVPENSWYAQAVAWAVENDVTSGTTPTTFSPYRTCTRAQIVTFLYQAFHENT